MCKDDWISFHFKQLVKYLKVTAMKKDYQSHQLRQDDIDNSPH